MACHADTAGESIPKQVNVSLGKDGILNYPAQLDYLSPNVDLNTGTLNIRARLDNPKGILKSGLYVASHYLMENRKMQSSYLMPLSVQTNWVNTCM